jgi:thiamine pyrophosphokinase
VKVGLVLNGTPPTPAELALLDACDTVVCADGGANAVVASGRAPRVIVGDLDSLRPEARRAAEERGVELQVHPARKDATDGELALQRALAAQPAELLLLGALGGSTAMSLASLHLLHRAAQRGVAARIVHAGEVLRIAGRGGHALDARDGMRLSLLPWEGDAVLSLEGTAWDAQRLRIPRGSARGVSNRILGARAGLTVHEGWVLVEQRQ